MLFYPKPGKIARENRRKPGNSEKKLDSLPRLCYNMVNLTKRV